MQGLTGAVKFHRRKGQLFGNVRVLDGRSVRDLGKRRRVLAYWSQAPTEPRKVKGRGGGGGGGGGLD